MGKILGLIALPVVAIVIAAELILQLAALFAPDRTSAWRSGATDRILCVGDSHTWGAGLEREESYPAHLQQALDVAEPGTHSVMNLGVPGMNTSQLRNRVPEWISRHHPDILIVWVGVNNAWNSAEADEVPGRLRERVDRVLLSSRFYRLIRVYVHDLGLEGYPVRRPEDLLWALQKDSVPLSFPVKHDGVVERIEHRRDPSKDLPNTLEDFRAIAEYARVTGVRIIFVGYPLFLYPFREASLAMWQVAEEYDVPFIPSWESLLRVPPERREWLWAMHPGSLIYREIARDVANAVLDRDAGYTTRPAREEFLSFLREQSTLLFRAVKQVALAVPPFTAEERKVFDALQGFAQTQLTPEALQPIAAVEAATAIVEPNMRASIVSVLELLSRADGQMDPEELVYIEAITAEIQQNATGEDTK